MRHADTNIIGRTGPARPLSDAKGGERVRLVNVLGGRGIRQRLCSMGLLPGAVMKVVANSGRGPVTVALGEMRLVLGRGIVHRVMVADVRLEETPPA